MAFVVDHFINSTFRYGIARQENAAMLAGLATVAARLVSPGIAY